jgi:hypothetical protein
MIIYAQILYAFLDAITTLWGACYGCLVCLCMQKVSQELLNGSSRNVYDSWNLILGEFHEGV